MMPTLSSLKAPVAACRYDPLQWHHNERNNVSNQLRVDCSVNRLIEKISKLRVTGLCNRGIPCTRTSNAENVSIWWHHHAEDVMIPTFLLLVAQDAVDMAISSAPIYDEVGIRNSVGFQHNENLRCHRWRQLWYHNHYNDVILGAIASQITSLTIVFLTVYSDADQRKHQSSASLAFVWGIHRAQMASNAENVSIWSRHHGQLSVPSWYSKGWVLVIGLACRASNKEMVEEMNIH